MTKQETKYFSTSQISCYRGCKREWSYKYQERLKPRAVTRSLYMGSTLHKLLEIRANGLSWQEYLEQEVKPTYDKMSSADQESLGLDFIECCYNIMKQYDWMWGNENIKYLATEVKIDLKIKGRKRFLGFVDAIVEVDGDQYIMEHKSFKTTKMSMDQTWINQQTCLYAKALNSMGYNIKGVLWDMIKTASYKPPRILKDGSFGKQYGDQTIMSFLDVGLNIEDIPKAVYEDIKDNHLNFLDRYYTPIFPAVVDAVWNDFVETVNEICKNKSQARTLGKDCDWCEYKELCKTELTGGDVEYTKQLYFTNPLQREKDIMEEFKKTPWCQNCQKLAKEYGAEIDFNQCCLRCEEYNKYKGGEKQ